MKDEFKNKKVGELRKLKVSLPDLGIDKSLFESISKSFKVYEEQLKKVAESLQKTLEIIKLRNPVFIEEDWYLSEEVWLKFSLSEIYSITPNQLEKLLEKEFNIDSGTIKERIISKHPERNSIVEEIFKSYKRKHFYSVVILSYSFIDGISKKKFGLTFGGMTKN
jgi:hypothetical protein